MSTRNKPELFSKEAVEGVLVRIRNLSAEQWAEMIAWRPEGMTEEWPEVTSQAQVAATAASPGVVARTRRPLRVVTRTKRAGKKPAHR